MIGLLESFSFLLGGGQCSFQAKPFFCGSFSEEYPEYVGTQEIKGGYSLGSLKVTPKPISPNPMKSPHVLEEGREGPNCSLTPQFLGSRVFVAG